MYKELERRAARNVEKYKLERVGWGDELEGGYQNKLERQEGLDVEAGTCWNWYCTLIPVQETVALKAGK